MINPTPMAHTGISNMLCLPHWFRHRAHSKVIADPQSVDRLAPHAARGPHRSDRRLAPVGSLNRSCDRFGNRSLALPPSPLPFPQQYNDRTAPTGPREPRAVRTGAPRRRDHEVELRGAALVQPAAGFVGLVEQPPERLEPAPGEQLGAEPRERGLADDVQRPGAQRLRQGLLEAGPPRQRPAPEPPQPPQPEAPTRPPPPR